MATVRPLGSVSRVAVVMLGEAREAPAAAQARGALVRLTLIAATWAAGPASGGRGWEASEWWGRPTDAGPRQAAFWTWMGVTAAVGRSWLCAVTTGDGREHRKGQGPSINTAYQNVSRPTSLCQAIMRGSYCYLLQESVDGE